MSRQSFISCFTAIVIVAAVLRCIALTAGSFDLDEGFTAMMVREPAADILRLSKYEANPPLGWLVYRAWTSIGGRSELAFELVSVIFGVGAVALIIILGNQLWDRQTGLIAGGLLAVSEFHVHMSQYVRVYSLGVFLSLLTAILVSTLRNKPSPRRALLAACATALFVNSHYVALLVCGGFFLAALVVLGDQPTGSIRRRSRMLVVWTGVTLTVCLPTLFLLYQQYFLYPSFLGVKPPSFDEVLLTVDRIHSYSPILVAVWGLFFVVGLWRCRRSPVERDAVYFLLCWLVVPIGLAALASTVGKSFFLSRYFILVLPAYLLLVAAGLRRVGGKWFGGMLAAVILVGSTFSLSRYYDERRETAVLKEAYRYVSLNYEPGDVIIHQHKYSFVPSLYYHDYGLPEFFFAGAEGATVLDRWYQARTRITLSEAGDFHRMWLCAAAPFLDPAIVGLLHSPTLKPFKPTLRYRSPESHVLLIEFAGAGTEHSGKETL